MSIIFFQKETKIKVGNNSLSIDYQSLGITALELYRKRDVVEKAFGNAKDRLSGRRLPVSSSLYR